MYHIPDVERFLEAILPELTRRAVESGVTAAAGAGPDGRRPPLAAPHRGERRVAGRARQAEPAPPDAQPRRLRPAGRWATPASTGAATEEGFESSTGTALDAARILFPVRPIWRSPLDSATA